MAAECTDGAVNGLNAVFCTGFLPVFADVGRNSGSPDRWFFAEMTKFAWLVCARLLVFNPDIALQNKKTVSA